LCPRKNRWSQQALFPALENTSNGRITSDKKSNGRIQKVNGKGPAHFGKRDPGPDQVIPFDDRDISQF
jgi:hypothetical protein